MPLVKAGLASTLEGIFSAKNMPMPVGMQVANAYQTYLMGAMDMFGGATLVIAGTASCGQTLGGIYQSQPPTPVQCAQKHADAFAAMASTYKSLWGIAPPVAPGAPLAAQLIPIFTNQPPSSKDFADAFAGALDAWTKTWMLSCLFIPPAPPSVPGTGPIS